MRGAKVPPIYWRVGSPEKETNEPEALLPAGGLQWAGLILVAMALSAIFANVQNARRAQIETVTIAPAAPTPALSPSVP